MKEYRESNMTIPITSMVMNGRILSLDEFLEGKEEWLEMSREE